MIEQTSHHERALEQCYCLLATTRFKLQKGKRQVKLAYIGSLQQFLLRPFSGTICPLASQAQSYAAY